MNIFKWLMRISAKRRSFLDTTAKIQTRGFKMAVHKTMRHVMDATSIIYTVYALNTAEPSCTSPETPRRSLTRNFGWHLSEHRDKVPLKIKHG